MNSQDSGSDRSSLWNFCVRSSDVIWRENNFGGVAKCRFFSQATEGIALGPIEADCRFQCSVACNSSKLSFYGKRSKSRENARVSKGKTRKGQTPLNGELARRLSALYSNPEFNWNERHSIKSVWTAWKDLHTSIRSVLSHDNFHWLYNLHRHWWGHEGCICSTMGFSTDMVYYVLVQNSYHMLVVRKELNNLKTKTDSRGTLGFCDKKNSKK